MNAEEIVRALREMLPPKVDYAKLVCAEGLAHGRCYVWDDPEPYIISAAADLIESLQAQLAKYDEVAAEYGIDGKTMLTLAKSQIKTAQDNIKLREQLAASQRRAQDARNELCLKCGRYRESHKGACNGCRWKE